MDGENREHEREWGERTRNGIPRRRETLGELEGYVGAPQGQSTAMNRQRGRPRTGESTSQREAGVNMSANTTRGYQAKLPKVKPFPEGVTPTAQLEQWDLWRDNFEMALERVEGTLSERDMAVELSLNIGEEVRKIISARGMLPKRQSVPEGFQFYRELVNGLEQHFQSLTDVSVDVTLFDGIRQKESETIMDFDMRLRLLAKRIKVNNEHVVRKRLLEGMLDQAVAERALMDGISHNEVVKMVSRKEAVAKCKREGPSPWLSQRPQTQVIAAIEKKIPETGTEERSRQRDERQVYQARQSSSGAGRGEDQARFQARPQSERQVKSREARPGECRNCGMRHGGGGCPAAGKSCNGCGKLGHFQYMCRSEAPRRQESAKRVRNIYEDVEDSQEVR